MKLDLKLEIESHRGIADIHFGMTADQIRTLLEATPTNFRRTPTDPPTDHYTTLGIQIHYTPDRACEAIELTTPAVPTFKGKPLIGQPFNTIRDWLQTIDPTLETDETGLTAPAIGIGIYAPFTQSHPEAAIESVIIFAPNYYG